MTKQPSYRFVGHTEPWAEKKLGEVAELLNGRAYKQEELLEDGEYRVLRVGNFNTNDRWYYSDLQLEDSKYANYGDLLYLWATNFGPELWKEEKVIYHYHIWKISGYSNILDKYYFYTFLEKDKNKIKQNTNGSTMVHITKGMMEERVLTFPSLPEQTAIGSFFHDIDQLISLQQSKLEVLKDQKKTYLKLLFPAKGQTKPALRFAGFEDDWQEVKLGEIGETYTGLSGKTKEDFGHGEGKFITYVNVFNNPLTDLYGLDSVEIDDKQRRVQYGDVLFTTSSETPEDVGLSSVWMGTEDNVYLNSFCFGYRPQKGIFDLYYLAFVLRSFSVRREFMLLAQGISRFNISKTKVMDMAIHVPSLPEQEAIGSFFQDLDKAIAKQEEKVNQLKESKQTLLRKMFI